ncbi:MAG: hypothetical protein K2Y56_06345 [Methylobacterium sp.]|uniref:hypothetical protein n=1 Tax=Methylobacterium sp. TaxID=409 RepID=UPI0025FF2EBD|nr:hypothetical protein [Methylobacterium sp.]MBX9931143.1 hypothetical protein [Methylobacterium sp.]
MTARLLTNTLAFALSLSAGAAVAQSYNAPAGIPAAVAPGGLQGRAAAYNLAEEARGFGRVVRGDDVSTGSVRSRRSGADAGRR